MGFRPVAGAIDLTCIDWSLQTTSRRATGPKHGHLATVARDLGISVGLLEDRAEGRGQPLDAERLQLLTLDLFGGAAEYDVASGMLRSANRQEARAIGPGPSPIWEVMELPRYEGGPPPAQTGYGGAPVTKPPRPGWAD